MKNLLYLSAIIFAIIMTFSCTDKSGYTSDGDDVEFEDTISLQTFNSWRGLWMAHGQDYIKDTLTKYFTFPIEDIKDFDENRSDSVVAARFYLGLEPLGTDTMPHLMLVGVNSRGLDVIDFDDKQYIYDFSLPCPSMCGAESVPKK